MRKLFAVVWLWLAASACWRDVIYHPTHLSAQELADLTKVSGWEIQHLHGEQPLVGLIRRPASNAQPAPWIVYFPGNAMSLASSQEVLRSVSNHRFWGLATWAYRGYDGSGGAPVETALHADAMAIAAHLFNDEHVQPQQLFIMGESLGSGIAAPLAGALAQQGKAPAGLILINAYTSMARVFDDHVPVVPVGWLVADPFPTDSVVSTVQSPVLLLYGEHDNLIPPHHSNELAAKLGNRATLVPIAGAGHNDVWAAAAASQAVMQFIELHGPSQP